MQSQHTEVILKKSILKYQENALAKFFFELHARGLNFIKWKES